MGTEGDMPRGGGKTRWRQDKEERNFVKNLYRILGVPEQADSGRVRQAYRELAKKYHPDLNPGDREAAERFREAADAYGILGDPGKRKKYDEDLKREREAGRKKVAGSPQDSGTAGGPPPWADFMKRAGTGKANPADVTDMFERYMKMR